MKKKQITFFLIKVMLLASFYAIAEFDAQSLQYDSSKPVEVSFGNGKPCSLVLQFRVDRFPDLKEGEWSDVSPMTLFKMESADKREFLYFARIVNRRLTVTLFKKDRSYHYTLTASPPVQPGVWNHMVLTDNGSETRLYLNGEFSGYSWHARSLPHFVRMWIGADGKNRRLFLGDFKKEFEFFKRVLTEQEITEHYHKAAPAAVRESADKHRLAYEKIRYRQPKIPYRALRVTADDHHPLIDQLGVHTTAVSWYDKAGRDLLCEGDGAFGSRLAVYRFMNMADGLPVYDNGTAVDNLPHGYYRALANSRGTFDLFAVGSKTFLGAESLVQMLNCGEPGQPEFHMRQVRFDDKTMRAVLHRGPASWALEDINNDGVADFIYVSYLSTGQNMSFPFEGTPWTGKEMRYAGSGRGYDVRGNWIGHNQIAEYHWAPGVMDADGGLNFGKSSQIMTGTKEFPLLWKTVKSRRAITVLKLDGRNWLITTGDVDEIMAIEIEYRDGVVYSGQAQPLLRNGYVMPHTYLPLTITRVDLDQDGFDELLMDGPAGVTSVIKGRRIGEFESLGVAQTRGGYLAGESLTSPCRMDWDDDGIPDLLTGDASGHVWFWRGTKDPWRYESPIPFTVDGVPYKPVAGMSGSIQGPNEKRWGYTKVVAGTWNGRKTMVVNDITGEMVLFYPDKGGAALQSPLPFTRDGEPYKVAWRSRPDFVYAASGFAAVPHDALLVQDWDGDMAVAIPDAPGSVNIKSEEKLRYSDGETIRLCGPVGLWGRGAVSLFDWDGDGNLDLIFGTNRSCQKVFSESRKDKGAVPFLIRNEGTNAKPVFARPRPFVLKSGIELQFGVHNATPWITDLNGDGKADMLIGAEDGKVYGFLNEELIVAE
jgi:hypothetical protein